MYDFDLDPFCDPHYGFLQGRNSCNCRGHVTAEVHAVPQQSQPLQVYHVLIYVDFYRNTKICHQQGYIPEMSKDDVPEELKGKEREIFGNMKQILEWHKR